MLRQWLATMQSVMVFEKPMSRRFVEDVVVDDGRRASPVGRLMLLVDVLLTSSMVMSRNHLEVRVDLDDEEEGMMKPGMMSSKSMKMR